MFLVTPVLFIGTIYLIGILIIFNCKYQYFIIEYLFTLFCAILLFYYILWLCC
nr:MAG TPA: hypothetical protein [Bacteriophage sp.]